MEICSGAGCTEFIQLVVMACKAHLSSTRARQGEQIFALSPCRLVSVVLLLITSISIDIGVTLFLIHSLNEYGLLTGESSSKFDLSKGAPAK